MSNPTDADAEKALDLVLPRFPARWRKQLKRLGLDSFSNFLNEKNEELLYTIKSGNTVLMARCLWVSRTPQGYPSKVVRDIVVEAEPTTYLLCNLEVIHTRGAASVSVP